MFSRLELLIGNDINKLHNANILVIGVGGVGGYVVEMLARSGVGNITVIDYDVVDISNKNRQIIALDDTIGKFKVDVIRDRINSFYKECNVISINCKVTADNINDFVLEKYDYVVDAIDMIDSKVAIIKCCHNLNIPIISAMGVGNRLGVPNMKIVDIYDTHDDGLAKVLRKKLRTAGVESHKVVFCDNTTITCGNKIGSLACFPAVCGCMLASEVINDLLK